MKDALDIDWAEATAYEMTGALRFSGVLADDDYQSEQTARLEIAATLRRRCVPIERVAELEAQLAAAQPAIEAWAQHQADNERQAQLQEEMIAEGLIKRPFWQ